MKTRTITITTPDSRRSLWKLEFNGTFRALRIRNYRLYFCGLIVSLVGVWMQVMAEQWLVYRLTHSALWLGIIGFCAQGTAFFISPMAGILADRKDRRKLLIWTQIAGLIQAFILSALVFSHVVQVWHVAVLAVVLGSSNAFEITTRQAFAVDLVGMEDLSSAIGLNSVMFNISRVVGPVIAGLLVGILGEGSEGWCFLANGLSFLAVVVSLVTMDPSQLRKRAPTSDVAKKPPFKDQIRVGLDYVLRMPKIRHLIVFAAFATFIGVPSSLLYPVIAKTEFGNVSALAWLTSMGGVGAILGALRRGSGKLPAGGIWSALTMDLCGVGMAYVFLGFSRNLLLASAASAILGFFIMGIFPLVSTTINHEVEDAKRARVLSLYNMAFLGAAPLGSLMCGGLVDAVGVRTTAIGFGTVCLATTGLIMKMRAVSDISSLRPQETRTASHTPAPVVGPSSPQ